MQPLSLYVHVPWCQTKCSYCDFYSLPASASPWIDQQMQYASALLLEADYQLSRLLGAKRCLQSIYFGGGTPSLLSEAFFQQIIDHLTQAISVAPNIEISAEANPGDVTADRCADWARVGINRISLGAQSYNEDDLCLLERRHSVASIQRAMEHVCSSQSFSAVSADLIFAIPGQSLSSWCSSLRHLLEYPLQHLSIYGLKVETATPLFAKVQRGEYPLPSEDAYAAMFTFGQECLTDAGFDQYEISNFARPGFQCRHNLAYWRNQDYLGLGVKAHSHVTRERWSFPGSLSDYLEVFAEPQAFLMHSVYDYVEQSPIDCLTDAIFMGLRLHDGINCRQIYEEYGYDLLARQSVAIDSLIQNNLIVVAQNQMFIPPHAYILSNGIIGKIIAELS